MPAVLTAIIINITGITSLAFAQAAYIASTIVIAVGLSYVSSLLTARAFDIGSRRADTLRTIRSAVTPARWIWGRARVGGMLAFYGERDGPNGAKTCISRSCWPRARARRSSGFGWTARRSASPAAPASQGTLARNSPKRESMPGSCGSTNISMPTAPKVRHCAPPPPLAIGPRTTSSTASPGCMSSCVSRPMATISTSASGRGRPTQLPGPRPQVHLAGANHGGLDRECRGDPLLVAQEPTRDPGGRHRHGELHRRPYPFRSNDQPVPAGRL